MITLIKELLLLHKIGYKGYIFLMMLRCEFIEGSAKLTHTGTRGISVKNWCKINQYLCKYSKKYDATVLAILENIKQQEEIRNLSPSR